MPKSHSPGDTNWDAGVDLFIIKGNCRKIMKHKIIAIIPARGGSKRLPRKNVKIFLGKPLIARTIEQAKKSRYLDRVIVSTDDKEIAAVSRKYGAEVIKRPKKLAGDKARVIDTVFYLLAVLKKEKYRPDIAVLLQTTSPLRNTQDIDRAIELFLKNKCEAVISFYESDSLLWSFKMGKKYLEPVLGSRYLKQRSQDLAKVFVPNGALYVFTPENLRKYKSFYAKKLLPYVMPFQRSMDIDYKADLKLAELIVKRKI